MTRVCAICLVSVFSLLISVSWAKENAWARTILHDDGGRTISKQDQSTKVLEEWNYDKRNVLVTKKLFQLDGEGRALQGLIFDGKENLIARVEYGFDRYARVVEERMSDARGQVVRRVIFGYNASGTRLPAKVLRYGDGNLSTPIEMDASSMEPTIRTPGINNTPVVPTDRIEEGVQRAPSVSTKPGNR